MTLTMTEAKCSCCGEALPDIATMAICRPCAESIRGAGGWIVCRLHQSRELDPIPEIRRR